MNKLPSIVKQILTTSEVNKEIVFCECNGLCHLLNQFKACFSVDLTQFK